MKIRDRFKTKWRATNENRRRVEIARLSLSHVGPWPKTMKPVCLIVLIKPNTPSACQWWTANVQTEDGQNAGDCTYAVVDPRMSQTLLGLIAAEGYRIGVL